MPGTAFKTAVNPAENTERPVAAKPRGAKRPKLRIVEPAPQKTLKDLLSPLQYSQYERQRNLLDAIIAFTTVAAPAPAIQHSPAQSYVFAMTFGGGGKNGVQHVTLSPDA